MKGNEKNAYVTGLLMTYSVRDRQIKQLRYEMEHPPLASLNETIEAMSFAHGEGGGRSDGYVSDKTRYIALNYQGKANQLNSDVKTELVERLTELEREQERLKYYVSLLNELQKKAIEMFYFEGKTLDEVADELKASVRYVRSIKDKAITELVSMYEFVDALR